ncbi:MAG: hypothetical protein ACPHUF_14255 [Gammaproteobacteria bacterium]
MTVRALAIMVVVLALSACRSQTIVDRHTAVAAPPLAADGDSIVVLGRARGLAGPSDRDFVTCVGDKLAHHLPELNVIAEQAFLDAMYPWFETATAPSQVSQLGALFKNEAVRNRFEEKGIRYISWITGRTETVDSAGSISCAAGPGGAGCFGFKSWDDEADYEAALWAVDIKESAAMIATRTTGTSYVPALILPLPLLARVKSAACASMAEQLAQALTAPAPH